MAQVPQDSGYGKTWTIDSNGNVVPITQAPQNIQNGADLTSLVASLVGAADTTPNYQDIVNSQTNVLQPNYPAGSFDVTPFKTFYDKAFEQLAPYYKQLLDEAGGDLKVALGNLEQDYKIGKRTKLEDFEAGLADLGIKFPQEQTTLSGNLNKRGIALTENPQGQTSYAGGGRAATEVGILNEDQRLRKEAVDRTKQRGLETAALTKIRGEESAQQKYRNTTEAQQLEHETRATTLGGQYQSAEQAAKLAGINKAQMEAETGTVAKSKNVNPNDVGSIKANFPGYAGWNNEQAILSDYAATLGLGKE